MNKTIEMFSLSGEEPEEMKRIFCDKCKDLMLVPVESENKTCIDCSGHAVDEMQTEMEEIIRDEAQSMGYG